MRDANDLSTHMVQAGEDLVIRMEIPAWSEEPVLFVEHFDEMLRIRGQFGSRKGDAFAKSIPIRCGEERPQASLQDGVLSIRVKNPIIPRHSTVPNTIT